MAATSADAYLEHSLKIAELLDGHKAQQTVVLDVSEICSFADFLVISTVTSQGHLRGLLVRLDELFSERDIIPLHPRRRSEEAGWVLIDLGFAVVHLMTREMRDFYELESLWFGARTVFEAPELRV